MAATACLSFDVCSIRRFVQITLANIEEPLTLSSKVQEATAYEAKKQPNSASVRLPSHTRMMLDLGPYRIGPGICALCLEADSVRYCGYLEPDVTSIFLLMA